MTRTIPLCAAVLALACGCEAEPAPRARSAVVEAEVTRDVAANVARRDAAAHFQGFAVAYVNVQPAGHFWVVELRSSGGRGLHYAVSKDDGTIRERSMVQ